MKLNINSVQILGRNKQIINKIKDKFGTIEQFAAAVNMSEKTIRQYLKQKKDLPKEFIDNKLRPHFGNYSDLVKSPEQQIEENINQLMGEIHLYTEDADLEVLDHVLKLAIDYNLPKAISKGYRNMGMYYLRRGQYDFSIRFFNLGMVQAQKNNDYNTECLIISELVTTLVYMGRYRDAEKLCIKFEEQNKLSKVGEFEKFWYYYNLAELYIYSSDYICAQGAVNRALASSQEHSYRKLKCYNLLGVIHKNMQDYKTALFYYNEALSLADTDKLKAICFNNLANLYWDMGNKEAAQDNIGNALKYIDLNSIQEYIFIYNTYAKIKRTADSTDKLFNILDHLHRGFFPPYVLDSIAIIIEQTNDAARIKSTIKRHIKYNADDKYFVAELYKLLGMAVVKMEVE